MHAVVMHERGGPEVLRYETIPIPIPANGEVLVKVHAATVNHTDIFHRTGQFFIQKELPHVLGMDVAGEIVALGEGVTGWRIGDRVVATFEALGRERDGAYAEYTTLPTDQLRHIPEGLDYTVAASIGLAFTTAWIALFYVGNLGAGDRIAIHAAASGVGTSAIQIAHWNDAQVIAITAAEKAERLRPLGAEVVVDRKMDIVKAVKDATGGRGATLVLDLVGNPTLQSSIDMVTRNGRIVCAGTLGGDITQINIMDLLMKNVSIRGSFGIIRQEDFEKILRLFARGAFKPVIDSILPLSEAKAAHEKIESRQTFGKVILVPQAE
jgi:NADPH:quinone reductase-like Zn-dependent oxidoreductase